MAGELPRRERHAENAGGESGICAEGRMCKCFSLQVYYCERDIRYAAKKMWYVCEFVRGRNVDDALVHLRFVPRKGAVLMREILEETKKKARDECDIEHPSDMWISECEVEDTSRRLR